VAKQEWIDPGDTQIDRDGAGHSWLLDWGQSSHGQPIPFIEVSCQKIVNPDLEIRVRLP
jgi:hypothetical protein